jgi:hypothetical protein
VKIMETMPQHKFVAVSKFASPNMMYIWGKFRINLKFVLKLLLDLHESYNFYQKNKLLSHE